MHDMPADCEFRVVPVEFVERATPLADIRNTQPPRLA
jgi:hypothetical protein